MGSNNITADSSTVASLAEAGIDIRHRPLIGLTLSFFALTLAVSKLAASPLFDKDDGATRELHDALSTTLADARGAINNSDASELDLELDYVLRPKAVFALAAALVAAAHTDELWGAPSEREFALATEVLAAYVLSARQRDALRLDEAADTVEIIAEHLSLAEVFGKVPTDSDRLVSLLTQKLDALFRDDDSPSSDAIVQ